MSKFCSHYAKAVILIHVAMVLVHSRYAIASDSVCNSDDYTLKLYGSAVPKPLGDCSGNGQCVKNNTKCQCDKGWTGLSDFINTEEIDCQIHIIAVKILWSLVLLHALYSQWLVIPWLRFRWRSHVQTRLKANGGRTPWIKNKIFMAASAYELLVFPSILSLSMIRIFSDSQRVGVTFAPTMFLALMGIGFYLGHYFWQPTVIETSVRGLSALDQEKVRTEIRVHRGVAVVHDILSVVKWFIPFVVYANNGTLNEASTRAWKLYLLLQFFTLIITGSQAGYAMFKLRELSNVMFTNGTSPARTLLEQLEGVQKKQVKLAFVYCSFYLAYLCIPFLWNKYDYFLPLTAFSFTVSGNNVITNNGEKIAVKVASSKGSANSSGDKQDSPTGSIDTSNITAKPTDVDL